jgi:hypothetical protein
VFSFSHFSRHALQPALPLIYPPPNLRRFDRALSITIFINSLILLNTRPEAIAIQHELCTGCGVSEFWFMAYIDLLF